MNRPSTNTRKQAPKYAISTRRSTGGSLPPVDLRVLIAYFGACFLVFVLGRFIAARLFHLDGVAQSVFGLGGIFANNVLLGIPLAKVTLGQASLPVISLVLVFNSLLMWTLATVSVEWARH